MLGHFELQGVQPLQHFVRRRGRGRRWLLQPLLVGQPHTQGEAGLPRQEAHAEGGGGQGGGNDDEGRHLRLRGLKTNCSALPTMARKSRWKDASPSLRSESTATKRPSRVTAW